MSDENQEGASATKPVSDPAAGILIDGVKEVFRGSEEADDGCAGAKRFKILGKEFLPEFLAETEQENSCRSN